MFDVKCVFCYITMCSKYLASFAWVVCSNACSCSCNASFVVVGF